MQGAPASQVRLPLPSPKDEGEALVSWRVPVGRASGSRGHANGRVFCIVTAHSVLGQKEGGIAFVIPRCGVFVAQIGRAPCGFGARPSRLKGNI